MEAGARSPEELEDLLEDAFVMRDRDDVRSLYADGAVMARGFGGADGGPACAEARGADAIVKAAAELWSTGRAYVGGARQVLQARDVALVVSEAAVHVARRRPDGMWHIAISLLRLPPPAHQEET